MSTLGFEEYIEPLKLYLAKYRQVLLPTCILVFVYLIFYLKQSESEKQTGTFSQEDLKM